MTVAMNQIPTNLRVPFAYTEFDNSKAVTGAQAKPLKVLVIGQRLSSGTVAEGVLTRITSLKQAKEFFGEGSLLHDMFKAYVKANAFTETWAIALDDASAGVKAAGSVLFAGTATEAGTISFYIGDQKIQIPVAVGDDGADIATAFAAEIEATADALVNAAVDGSTEEEVDLTFKHKGLVGNYLPLQFNYQSDEAFPAGISATITAMSGGTTNPDVADAIAALPDVQYDFVIHPYTDSGNLAALEEELTRRFGPLVQIDGRAITASNVSLSNLSTLGESRNSPHSCIIASTGRPTPPWKVAASAGGVIAYYQAIDPARPVQTLELPGVLAAPEANQFLLSERNILLYDGISTIKDAAGGKVRIERMITTYRLNDAEAEDPSYLNLEVMSTLSYLRWDWNNYILGKYPRHKLAADGIRASSSQPIMTPKLMKAEAVAKFEQWEQNGLVENVAQFKNDLICEIDDGDKDVMGLYMSPDLVNQFRILKTRIAFLL